MGRGRRARKGQAGSARIESTVNILQKERRGRSEKGRKAIPHSLPTQGPKKKKKNGKRGEVKSRPREVNVSKVRRPPTTPQQPTKHVSYWHRKANEKNCKHLTVTPTLSSHSHFQALFEPAILTLVPMMLVNRTVPIATARIRQIPPDAPLEKRLAPFARELTIMLAGRLVAAHHAFDMLLLLVRTLLRRRWRLRVGHRRRPRRRGGNVFAGGARSRIRIPPTDGQSHAVIEVTALPEPPWWARRIAATLHLEGETGSYVVIKVRAGWGVTSLPTNFRSFENRGRRKQN